MEASIMEEQKAPSKEPVARTSAGNVLDVVDAFKQGGRADRKDASTFGCEAEYLCKIEWLKEAGNRLASELETICSTLADTQLLLKKERLKSRLACVLRRFSERYHVLLSKSFFTLKWAPSVRFQRQLRTSDSKSEQLQTLQRIEQELSKLKVRMQQELQPAIGFESMNAHVLYALFSGRKMNNVFDRRVLTVIASFLGDNKSLRNHVHASLQAQSPNQEDVRCTSRSTDSGADESLTLQRTEHTNIRSSERSKRSHISQSRKLPSHANRKGHFQQPGGKSLTHVGTDLSRAPQQRIEDILAENRKLQEKLAERQKTCDVLSKKLCTLTTRSVPITRKSQRSSAQKRAKP